MDKSTVYTLLTVLKVMITICGFIGIVYFLILSFKDRSNLRKAIKVLAVTGIVLLAITAIEFAI